MRDFESVVEVVIRDAVELFEGQRRLEFNSVRQAENKIFIDSTDMNAVRAVSQDTPDEPHNPRPIVEERAARAFEERYLDHDDRWTDIPIS